MKIFLVEEHTHYELQTITSAHIDKEFAIEAAIESGKEFKSEIKMIQYEGSLLVCGSSMISINVIEVELDMRTKP